MTPLKIAALTLGAAGLVGLGLVVGDFLSDDPVPGDAPPRAAVEVAAAGAPDAQTPALSIVSVGAGTAEDGDSANGDDADPDGSSGSVGTSGGLTPADLSPDAIDIDTFEAFDAAAEEGTGEPADLPDLPDGPAVEVTEEEAYAPADGDEGTVDDLPGAGGDGAAGDGDEPTDASGDDGPSSDGAPPVERPAGVPALDPDIYDFPLPAVLGFDDPCAVGSPSGCPFGIPAVVLGNDPTVPLRLGSVGVLGTEPFHRNACTSIRSREMMDAEGATQPVILAITTNQGAELDVSFDGVDEARTASPEEADLALAELAMELRDDGRIPSVGPGSVVTCVVAPAASTEDGLLRGKARATTGGQQDTLGFELRLAGPGRSRPISFSDARGLPAPTGSAPFELTVPQPDPEDSIAVVGFAPLDGPSVGRADCAAFAPMLDEVRAQTFGGRGDDDGAPALPVGLPLRASDGTRVSPVGTFPAAAGVPDGYNATYRGYLPRGATYRLCAWWFDLEEADGGHRVIGPPSDTAVVEVEVGLGLSSGVYVTAITLPEPRPPGHYSLYLVKPGALAVCLPRKRPDGFPSGPSRELAAVEREASIDAETSTDANTSTGAETSIDAETRTEEAATTIPAGRHDFGPGQPQEVVPICVPSALAPVAFPMVKAGSRPYRPGSPPVLVEPDPLPVIPDGPGIVAPPVTYPVLAPDGAILDLTVVPRTTTGRTRTFLLGPEEPQPPATVESTLAFVEEPTFDGDERPDSPRLTMRFNENVDVRVRLTDPRSDDPSDVCTTGAGVVEAVSPNGPAHDVRFAGLCAGVTYSSTIEATDADGTTATFDGGSYRVPPNAGFFDVAVRVTSVPEGGAELGVADVQFLRQPGVVSLGTRVRADDLLATCLGGDELDDDATVLTSFGELARLRVRIEGAAGCDGGRALRIDSTLELAATDLTAGPVVFDLSHPSGLTLRVTITPRSLL